MKLKDFIVLIVVVLVFLPFFVFDDVYNLYITLNKEHAMLMSFVKFAILATFGECLGLRIKAGVYNKAGFGLVPRAVIWGILGLFINTAFVIFAKGAPAFLESLGISNVIEAFTNKEFSWSKLLAAFTISLTMNLIFAPVMMTLHKITDIHIEQYNGSLKSLVTPIAYKNIFPSINWNVQWNFVFKKTIPFFWIPAHTITFMLPSEFRVLFAALLGIALGVILSIAAIKSRNEK